MDSAKNCSAVFEEVIPTGICNIVSEGLVVCHLYENDTNDSSGYKNHGIESGNFTYFDGINGKYIYFDGNNYLKIPDNSSLDTDKAMSLSMLIKFDHLDNEHGSWFMTKFCSSGPCPDIGTPEGDWVLRTGFNAGSENGEDLIFGVQNYVKYQESANLVKMPSILSVNTWQHLVITFDTGVIKMYINGQLIKESIRSVEEMSTQEYTLDDIFIGKTRFTNSNQYDFIGALDEFRLYNRAITEQEIQTLYNLGQPPSGLTVTKSGERGRILAKINGEDTWTITCNSDCQQANYNYPPNSQLIIRAYPDQGFIFTGWTGDCTSTTSKFKLTLDTPKTCTAQFEPNSTNNLLTITKTGNGTIISNDNYINCGDTCSSSYVPNQNVTLTAIPTTNELFIGWTGDCNGINPKLIVTMDTAKSCSATFQTYDANESFTLEVINNGEGFGTIAARLKGESNSLLCRGSKGCKSDQQEYQAGTKLTVSAVPNVDHEIVGVSGDCPWEIDADGKAYANIIMEQDKSCTANFVQKNDPNVMLHKLTIYNIGFGSGTINNPGRIDCGESCTADYYQDDTTIRLKAAASKLSKFIGWTGDCEGKNADLKLTINQDMICTANFQNYFELIAEEMVEAFYTTAKLANEISVEEIYPRINNEERLKEAFSYSIIEIMQVDRNLRRSKSEQWPTQLNGIEMLPSDLDTNYIRSIKIIKTMDSEFISIGVNLVSADGTELLTKINIIYYMDESLNNDLENSTVYFSRSEINI